MRRRGGVGEISREKRGKVEQRAGGSGSSPLEY